MGAIGLSAFIACLLLSQSMVDPGTSQEPGPERLTTTETALCARSFAPTAVNNDGEGAGV